MKVLSLCSIILFLFFFQVLGQWHNITLPSDEGFNSGSFVSKTTGWIVGNNYIYKTEDGGENWIQQIESNSGGQLIYALNDSTVFYANWDASDGLLMTPDGGSNWTSVDNLKLYYTEIDFINDQIGYICGRKLDYTSIIRKTDDGGKSWNTVATNFTFGNYEIIGISFINENEGWAVSYDAYILHSVDGGVNWEIQDSIGYNLGYDLPLRDIEFVNADSGWAVGGLTGRMIIARTINGGETWIEDEVQGNSLREVRFLNSKKGWTVGFGYGPFIAKTDDGGVTWTESTLTPNLSGGQGFNTLSLTKDSTAWAVGSHVYNTNFNSATNLEEWIVDPRPNDFQLLANYPNPFNPVTYIPFKLPERTHVKISIFDIQGRELEILVDKEFLPGTHKIKWDARYRASGLYICKLQTENYQSSEKLLLVK